MTQFDLYFLSKPEVKVEYLKKIISQQPQEVNSQFCTIVQIVNCQKIFTKKWPQFDLYFLSKPEVKVYYLKKSYLNNRKR